MDKNENSYRQVKTWICFVCGYEHIGTEPPKKSPQCGGRSDVF